jgi:hypothetical protein
LMWNLSVTSVNRRSVNANNENLRHTIQHHATVTVELHGVTQIFIVCPNLNSRAWARPGLSPTCQLKLLLHKPKARARTGLYFGLSLQSRPQARKPGQARKSLSPQYEARALPEPAFYRPDPAPPNSGLNRHLDDWAQPAGQDDVGAVGRIVLLEECAAWRQCYDFVWLSLQKMCSNGDNVITLLIFWHKKCIGICALKWLYQWETAERVYAFGSPATEMPSF